MTAVAAAAALVALALSLSTYERWLQRRRRHELAWTVALAMFFVAAAALWLGAADRWGPLTFRVFYLFGAILNVPFLALGTLYLLGGDERGDRWAAGIVVGAAFAAGVVLVAPLTARVPPHRLPQGSEVFGPLPRVLAAVASGGGAVVVLGGAAWSAWRFRRGPMVWANALIASGTLVLGASGLLNSALGEMEAFAVSLAVGITLIFVGTLVAATSAARPDATAGRARGTTAVRRSAATSS